MTKPWSSFSFGMAAACVLLLPAGLKAAGCRIVPDATDAVTAAPANHKVILENDTVRVLEAKVPLHSREVPHTHFWPSVFFEDHSGASEPAFSNLNIRWSEGGPSKGFASSDRDRHNILIELKNADCQPVPSPALPSTDAVTIHDPNISIALENAWVRVLNVKIPPGEKEPWHTHTWPAVVVYFHLPPSQRFAQDGTKTPRAELKEMQITFDANSQPLHSIENLGKVVYQAYRIELKPTTKVAGGSR